MQLQEEKFWPLTWAKRTWCCLCCFPVLHHSPFWNGNPLLSHIEFLVQWRCVFLYWCILQMFSFKSPAEFTWAPFAFILQFMLQFGFIYFHPYSDNSYGNTLQLKLKVICWHNELLLLHIFSVLNCSLEKIVVSA